MSYKPTKLTRANTPTISYHPYSLYKLSSEKLSFAITYDLLNCNTSNQSNIINENERYNAIITAADGYTLEGAIVSITMGGHDITSVVYDNGVINIESVTGDVFIRIHAINVIEEGSDCIKFSSTQPFSIQWWRNTPRWDGYIEYSQRDGIYSNWAGELINSEINYQTNRYEICFRGIGNTTITAGYRGFEITASDGVECTGNIENLLDYQSVQIGVHPPMGDSCFANLFYYCTTLITAPSLPIIHLSERCYYSMFYNCSSLMTIPALPATELPAYCYATMFAGCSEIIINDRSYAGDTPYCIPYTNYGIELGDYCLRLMFRYTKGLVEEPFINTTYYTPNRVIE